MVKAGLASGKQGMVSALFFLLLLITGVLPVSGANSSGRGDFEIRSGGMKVTLHRETGTFSLYRLAPTGKDRFEPVLDTRNYGAGTKFAVSADGRPFLLEKKPFLQPVFEAGEDGLSAAFVFTPSRDFQVRQRFFFREMPVAGIPQTVLVIETAVENTSGKEMEFGFRAVFDTMLGENGNSADGCHFSTSGGGRIFSETLLYPEPGKREFLFSSGPDGRCCTFLVSGADIRDTPSWIYLANWNRCVSVLSEPFRNAVNCTPGRSMSTVYAPDDSAAAFGWPVRVLADKETAAVEVCLSVIPPDSALSLIQAEERENVTAPQESVDLEFFLSSGQNPASRDLSFSEKQALYRRVMERMRQIDAEGISVSPSELAGLHRILDYLLEEDGI